MIKEEEFKMGDQVSLSFVQLTEERNHSLNAELAQKDTLDIIKWAYQQFEDELVYACSFGAESMVLIDLIYKVRQNAQIIFLDTHFHFEETYQLIKEVQSKYPELRIKMMEPDTTVQEQKELHGDQLWIRDPNQCCFIRKIKPLEKALSGATAWISGLRREQSVTRAATEYVNIDHRFQSIKICPLIHWTWEEVWSYIKAYQLPYNPLHDKGYPSIGCYHCTSPVDEDSDLRAGRWVNSQKTECGLHLSNK
jgi:phosphoadenosine phosphosulfate reductase